MLPALQFPVTVDVKKYLEFHLGKEYSLSETDPQGLLLASLLRRQSKDRQYDKFLPKCGEKFAVSIVPSFLLDSGCRNFTSHTVYKFNEFNEKLILNEAFAYIDLATEKYHQKANHAIYDFMDKYDFTDDDMNFDRLKKAYQRYSQKKASEEAKFTVSVVPPQIKRAPYL